MAATLKLTAAATAELDLSTYVVVAEDGGLDPADGGFLEPMFSESAVGDGQALVNVDTQNKELVFPLHLKAATKDALHTLVQTVRMKLSEPGVRVEWRDDGASLSTFYDLVYGRFEPSYKYFRARQKWLTGSLHLWTRPYGHTATERVVGTSSGSGFMQIVSLASVSGDVPALLIGELTSASQVRDLHGISVIPSGVKAEWSGADIVPGGATIVTVGASGAVGSQYRGVYADLSVVLTGQFLAWQFALTQASRMGRQRVFALARTGVLGGAYLTAQNGQTGDWLGPTAFLGATYPLAAGPDVGPGTGTQGQTYWQLMDLGVIDTPTPTQTLPTNSIFVYAGFASAAVGSLVASPALQVTSLYVLPEDRTAVVIDSSLNRTMPARMRWDGSANEVYDFSGLNPFTAMMRGGFPGVKATEQVALFAGGRAANLPLSAVVRVREQFSFQR